MEAAKHTDQEGGAMTDREKGDIDGDLSEPIQKEDDTCKKEQMVVSRHHVLGAEINIGPDRGALVIEQKLLIGTLDTVCGRQ